MNAQESRMLFRLAVYICKVCEIPEEVAFGLANDVVRAVRDLRGEDVQE